LESPLKDVTKRLPAQRSGDPGESAATWPWR